MSAAFKRNFAALQKKRTAHHPFERVATPYQVYSWTSPLLEHTLDAIRAEDSLYYFILKFSSLFILSNQKCNSVKTMN